MGLTLLTAYMVDESTGLCFFLLFVIMLIVGVCILLVNGLSNLLGNFLTGFRDWWHSKS